MSAIHSMTTIPTIIDPCLDCEMGFTVYRLIKCHSYIKYNVFKSARLGTK